MHEIKASVKDYILRITFGGDGQDISSAGNSVNHKPSPEWASFLENLLKSSPVNRAGEDKAKTMVKTAKKNFHPQKRPNLHPEAKRVKIQAFQAKRSPEKGDSTIYRTPGGWMRTR